MAKSGATRLSCQRVLRCVPQDFWGDKTIIGLLQEAPPDISDGQRFIELVSGYLDRHQELLETWQTYSYDKRSSSSPYLDRTEVGFFSGEGRNVRRDEKTLNTCVVFIYQLGSRTAGPRLTQPCPTSREGASRSGVQSIYDD